MPDYTDKPDLRVWTQRERGSDDGRDYLAITFSNPNTRGPNDLMYLTIEQGERLVESVGAALASTAPFRDRPRNAFR